VWHATILIINSVFENCDRCDFGDSMTSLILDGSAADHTESLAPRQLDPRLVALHLFKPLAYVKLDS
jgi:hypothetical protein